MCDHHREYHCLPLPAASQVWPACTAASMPGRALPVVMAAVAFLQFRFRHALSVLCVGLAVQSMCTVSLSCSLSHCHVCCAEAHPIITSAAACRQICRCGGWQRLCAAHVFRYVQHTRFPAIVCVASLCVLLVILAHALCQDVK